MRIFSRSIIKFSVFLTLILLFGQTVSSQENKCKYVSINDILIGYMKKQNLYKTTPEQIK